MAERLKYLKRATATVVAVQLDLDTEGFTYEKWGGTQTCKRRDWLVYNDGDTYTVDESAFERTYRPVSPGVYVKVTPVWAEVAEQAGEVRTLEGVTHYERGWYVVYNNAHGSDSYAMEPRSFEEMYKLAP